MCIRDRDTPRVDRQTSGASEGGSPAATSPDRDVALAASTEAVKQAAELCNAMKDTLAQFREQNAAGSDSAGVASTPNTGSSSGDKVNALVGIKFEKNVPILKDSDADFETHWRQFQSLLDCYSFGRTAVRPIDALNYYRLALPQGSTRALIYDTIFKQAMIDGRLPNDAQGVFDEIKDRLREAIRETLFQKQDLSLIHI